MLSFSSVKKAEITRVNHQSKSRTSEHKLMIEVGRHNHLIPLREEPVCYMCTTKMEDEIHFLTECKIYGSKDLFWNHVYQKFPQTSHLSNKDKIIFIMTQEDPEIMKLLLKTTR